MQAIVIAIAGEPEVLELRELPKPAPGPRELLVKVKAAGVNPIDAKIRSGKSGRPQDLPRVAGFDVSGVVEAIGTGVKSFREGDAVLGCVGLSSRAGAYAQYTVIDERIAAAKPEGVSFHEAAALPIPAITAWESLYDRANVQSGEFVLIHAGAGGVGSLAIQLAKLRGAFVMATASEPKSIELCRQLGANAVIDYQKQDFVEQVKSLTNGRGAAVVMDNVGGQTFIRSMETLDLGGRLVTIVERGMVELLPLFLRSATLHIEFMGAASMRGLYPEHHSDILKQVGQLVAAGKVKVALGEVLPLKEAVRAHQLIQTGHTRGKIVLKVE